MSTLQVSKFGPKLGRASHVPILVLLHGWGSSSKIWQPCVKEFENEFQIWCIDLPGYGENSDVIWDKSVSQALSLLVNVLPESCHLVGWSLGGLLAQLFVKHYPQQVQSLMLIASTPKFVASTDWPHAMPSDMFASFLKQFTISPKATLKKFRALQTLQSLSAKDCMRALNQASPKKDFEKIAWGLHWLQEIDLRDTCPAKGIPVQLLQGENDQVSSMQAAQQTVKLWQSTKNPKQTNIQICKIADAGHTPFLSHPKQFYQQVRLMISQ